MKIYFFAAILLDLVVVFYKSSIYSDIESGSRTIGSKMDLNVSNTQIFPRLCFKYQSIQVEKQALCENLILRQYLEVNQEPIYLNNEQILLIEALRTKELLSFEIFESRTLDYKEEIDQIQKITYNIQNLRNISKLGTYQNSNSYKSGKIANFMEYLSYFPTQILDYHFNEDQTNMDSDQTKSDLILGQFECEMMVEEILLNRSSKIISYRTDDSVGMIKNLHYFIAINQLIEKSICDAEYQDSYQPNAFLLTLSPNTHYRNSFIAEMKCQLIEYNHIPGSASLVRMDLFEQLLKQISTFVLKLEITQNSMPINKVVSTKKAL